MEPCTLARSPQRYKGGSDMENRITVTIFCTDYTLMAEESPSYMQKVAAWWTAR